MKRITIIGCAGSGKTYLAKELHKKLGLPLYHLDQYYWKPNWQRSNIEDFKIIHQQICDKAEWIIDGTPLKTLEYRLSRSDRVILLDISKWTCLYRVIKRTILNYGKVLPTSAPYCKERFDWEFIKWVWNYNKNTRPKIIGLLNKFPNKKIYVLKSSKDISIFLNHCN